MTNLNDINDIIEKSPKKLNGELKMIYVIRHGQTDWNIEDRTQGSIETKLNEEGMKEAENARKELLSVKIDVILCSPRKRCIETAKIICRSRNIPIIEIKELGERRFGEFEGKLKNIDYNWIEFWDWKTNKNFEKAENVRDFYERISLIIDKIKEEYIKKNVLIVTHSGVCAMIYCYLTNIKPNGKLKVPGTKNCEIMKYDIN